MSTLASAPPIQAVLFDYGLVLSGPPDPASWIALQTTLGATDPAFREAYWKHRHEYDRGELNGDSYWRQVASDLGHTLTPAEHQALLDADTALWTQPNQPMIDWARSLQAAGVRTGILSNLGDAMESGILLRCPWLSDFDHHTFSHRLLIAKPDPAIYAHAAQGLGVVPEGVLFIDDRAENIHAAQQSGMQAVQYLDHDTFVAEMRHRGYDALLDPATKV